MAHKQHINHIATVLSMMIFFLPQAADSASALPAAGDINNLAQTTRLTADTFMQQSAGPRMQYEFSGKFLTQDDKENLQKLAKRTITDLETIVNAQENLKQQIEDYTGDDWDQRYGVTGLWRKLSADVCTTTLTGCEINFYLALTASQQQRNNLLHNILAEMDFLNLTRLPATSQLLKARTLALLAQTEPGYKPLAKKELDLLMVRSDMSHSTAFRIAIERIKLLGQTDPDQLKTIAENIAKSKCSDDLELVLSLAILQLRLKQTETLEKTISIWPQTEDFLGPLILKDLSHRLTEAEPNKQPLQQISISEAELAALAIWKSNPWEYKTLLAHLSGAEKFQTPLILYVAAVTFAETSPTKAVNFLIKASGLQQLERSNKLDIEPDKIAEQAAQIAYNLYIQGSRSCQLATEAFDNYVAIAQGRIDEELEYLYSKVLSDCGSISKSEELLEIIANRSTGGWRNRARLDLIEQAIRNVRKPHSELLNQLRDFIAVCGASSEQQLLREAMTIYCQVFLESDDKSGAEKILDILTKAEAADKANLNVFKSKLLWKLERPNESVECMVGVIDPNNYEHGHEAMKLMRKVIEKIDQLPEQITDFLNFVKNCQIIAEYCKQIALTTYGRIPADPARLYLAEIAVFAANKEQEKLLEVDKLLDNLAKEGLSENVNFLRCQARLLTEQGKFDEAARLWAQICKIRKTSPPSSNQQNWKWWRAKFYELHCCSKMKQTKKQQIVHTIEVLENSFERLPPLWAEKLNSLKQQCRSQSTDPGK